MFPLRLLTAQVRNHSTSMTQLACQRHARVMAREVTLILGGTGKQSSGFQCLRALRGSCGSCGSLLGGRHWRGGRRRKRSARVEPPLAASQVATFRFLLQEGSSRRSVSHAFPSCPSIYFRVEEVPLALALMHWHTGTLKLEKIGNYQKKQKKNRESRCHLARKPEIAARVSNAMSHSSGHRPTSGHRTFGWHGCTE